MYLKHNGFFEMINHMMISYRFHSPEGTNTFKLALCAVSVTELWYTMKSLVVILGLLVAAVQVN